MEILYIKYGPGDRGSIPGRVIPKTLKMVLDTSLLNTQHYMVRIKGKELCPPLHLGVITIEKEPSGYPRLRSPTLILLYIYIYIYIYGESLCGVMVKVLRPRSKRVRTPVTQLSSLSNYYNRGRYKPLILQIMSLIVPLLFFYNNVLGIK